MAELDPNSSRTDNNGEMGDEIVIEVDFDEVLIRDVDVERQVSRR